MIPIKKKKKKQLTNENNISVRSTHAILKVRASVTLVTHITFDFS